MDDLDFNKFRQDLAQEAWAGYVKELTQDGFEAEMLAVLEATVLPYVSFRMLGALLERWSGGNNFDPPEEIGGYDGRYISNRSSTDVRKEIMYQYFDLLSNKNGHRLGGKIKQGRVRKIKENWNSCVTKQLAQRGQKRVIEQRLIRLIASDFHRFWQGRLIDDLDNVSTSAHASQEEENR